MNLTDLFELDSLTREMADGFVRRAKHPTLPLYVYCYTEKAVFESRWNAVTRSCRGLIADTDGTIAAFCMPKFFNAVEHIEGRAYAAPLPAEPFQLWPKMDGSLGTVFYYKDHWLVATKGGFQSEQAIWAQKWLDARDLSDLSKDKTYVVEIIYPENRIVVDYHGASMLTLLTVFGSNGIECMGPHHVLSWGLLDGAGTIHPQLNVLLSRVLFYAQRNQTVFGEDIDGTRAEGYVVKYQSGLRVKVKFADYIRMHGAVTGLTERHIWETLRHGQTLDALFEVLPDEYHDWVVATAARLSAAFTEHAGGLVAGLWDSKLPADPRVFQQLREGRPFLSELTDMYGVVAKHSWNFVKPEAIGPWKDRE